MAVDRLVQPRFPLQLGPKDRNRLQVGSAVEPVLQIAQERPDILDEVLEAVRTVLALHRVHLVPQIPREHHPARSPSLASKGEASLDEFARSSTGEQLGTVGARAAIRAIVRMVRPVVPGEEGVERRKKQSQPDLCAKTNQIVPQCHH